MKFVITLSFFIVLLVAWLTCAGSARAEFRCLEPAIDVGDVKAGAPLSHCFRLINQAKEPIEILEARASCGCLAPRLDRRFVDPGEAASLQVDVRTLGQAAGRHAWKAQVRYRAGTEVHELPLQIAAKVVTEIVVQPAALTFVAQGMIRQELTLTDVRLQPLTVTAVEAGLPFLRAKVTDQGGDEAGRRLVKIGLESVGELPDGRHEGLLGIYTDDASYRHLQIPITVIKNARSGVSAFPSEVRLTGTAGQPLPSRLVRLKSADSKPIVIERISADDAALTCTWAAGPEHFATVKVQVNHTRLLSKELRSAVHIHISSPVRETVTLPVIVNLD
jgi:hypothetical protein